jgi:hypothetical protein
MTMELLRRLADAQLPLTVLGTGEIELLRRLDMAGYVKAFIPPMHVDCDDCIRQGPAVVFEVTASGRKILGDSYAMQSGLPIQEGPTQDRPPDRGRRKGRWARLLARHSHR